MFGNYRKFKNARNRIPHFEKVQVELRQDDTDNFLYNQLKYANLQRTGNIRQEASDNKFRTNQDFWMFVLNNERIGLRWVELNYFQLSKWYPRTPGLFHTIDAMKARQEAEKFIREEKDIKIYEPNGKLRMIEGGLGSVRFKPLNLVDDDYWICTATSDGFVHSGVPIAIPNQLSQKTDVFNHKFRYKIIGQVNYLPSFLEKYFYHMKRIPQIYIKVEALELIEKDSTSDQVIITPMVFFAKRETDFDFNHTQLGTTDYVTYISCIGDSINTLNNASDWIQEYVDSYNGDIITNFDEQRPTFQNAPFSLQNIMSGRIPEDSSFFITIKKSNLIIRNANHIHMEENHMEQISIKLGNGVTITGDFNVANSIKNSYNIADKTNSSKELKNLLTNLTSEVGKMTESLPKNDAEEVARDLDTLVNEATSSTPRKQWWELSMESLKKAAENVGEIGEPVLKLLGLLLPILLKLKN